MTKLKLQIAHQVPGRIRMKMPAAKGNPELLEQIKTTFAVIPGIEEVTVNPATGSIVLHYDADRHDEFHGRLRHHYGENLAANRRPPTNEIDALANKIEEEAEFLAEHSQVARAVVDFFKKFDREIKVASGNAVDFKIVLAGGIAVFTVLEVGATAATPVWVTLAIFGLNHLVAAHAHPGAAPEQAPVVVKA